MLRKKLPRAGQKVRKENELKRFTTKLLRVRASKKILQMEVEEDFESSPHKALSFVVEREKEMQEWNEQKLPKVLPRYSGGRLPGRSREEGEKEESGVKSLKKWL